MHYIYIIVYWALAFIGVFLIYGVLSPYLVILIRDYGFNHSVLGILLALCEAMAIASPFVMSFFADRSRRYRSVMLVSLILSLFCGIILFFSKKLLICAIVLPVLAFSYRAIQPLLDAISTIKFGKKGNYGKYRAIGSLSFFLVVIFLQLTPFFTPNTAPNIAFWVIISSFLSIILIMLVPVSYFINDDDKPAASPPALNAEPARVSKPNYVVQRHSAVYNLWSPLFITGFLIIFFNRLAMSPINNFLSLYVVEQLKWDGVGFMWALSSGSEIIFIFLSKRLLQRFNALPLIAFSTSVVILRYIIILLFPSRGGIIVSQLTHSVCFGIFHPAAVSFITSCVPPAHRALGMSLYLSLGTGVPTLIGNLTGGFIVDYWGYRSLFIIFAVFAVFGLLIYFMTRKHTQRLLLESLV